MPSARLTFLLVAAGCASLMLIAWLYFQTWLGLNPCPLCMTQRIFVVAAGLVALAAFFHAPGQTGRRIYSVTGFLFSASGAGVAARHIWLQSLPADQVPACGPGLSYMFETLPFMQALEVLFQGDGNCADVVWSFLGLSIPGWTLVAFVSICAIFVWQFVRKDLPWH